MAYRTVKQESEIEQVIKRSRFIGRCFPVTNEQEALALLERIRRQHWDATHNCYAYSIGEHGACARFSDDGEPSGTAGMPMMEAIRRIGVTDVLVVVTRYFGGILLGAGGLVRAYASAAAAAIEAAGKLEIHRCAKLTLRVPYALWGRVETLLRERPQHVQIASVQYEAEVNASVWAFEEEAAGLIHAVVDRTDGSVRPLITAHAMRPFPSPEPAMQEQEKEER